MEKGKTTKMDRQQIWDTLENRILPLVQRPGRYVGGEVNSIIKNPNDVRARVALVFPDVYEVGMSNLGLKILYDEINSQKDYCAERVFVPWPDMESRMRQYAVPMFSLETHSPLKEFDIVGVSLQYELCYTNILTVLDLAGIPLFSEERLEGDYPLVIAGGLISYAPEPISKFVDLFVVGDGEEIFLKVIEFYNKYWKKYDRKQFLEELSKAIDCVYAPPLYKLEPDSKGRLSRIISDEDSSKKIRRHIVKTLEACRVPVKPIIPLIEAVHDRATIEIMRGCPRSCRFCQAGVLYKPVRRRSSDLIAESAVQFITNTGYGELGLLSLSSTDYSGINDLADRLLNTWEDRSVSISLPSMRVDSFSLELINRISKTKKTGITLAPEAASEKLLKVINKNYGPKDVLSIAEKAFRSGYRVIKLYFMIGLPREDDKDLDELVNLLYSVGKIGFIQVNVSISTLVPKPHTPFQWENMISLGEIQRKQNYLRDRVKRRNIKLKFHNPFLSILEGVFSRGDARLGDVILKAWQAGCRFDQWEECFRYDLWVDAFGSCGINMEDYLSGWECDASLPWDHIDCGLSKEFLLKEKIAAECASEKV